MWWRGRKSQGILGFSEKNGAIKIDCILDQIHAETHVPFLSHFFHHSCLYLLYYEWGMNLIFYLTVSKCSLQQSYEFVFTICTEGGYSLSSVWLGSAVFDPVPPWSIVPSLLLNLLQSEVGPPPLISPNAVEWLMFDLIASAVYEFTFDLPSLSPSGYCMSYWTRLFYAKAEVLQRIVCSRPSCKKCSFPKE